MRRGRVAFFDPASGEGIIVANGHEYPVRAGDVLAGPLGPRVPVEFDVVRDGAVPRAVAVRVRTGGRVNRRQGRFAETTARSADAAGSPPLSRRRPGLTRRRIGRPKSLVAECHRADSGRTYPGVYGRMEWDKPAPTMTTQCYGFGNGRFGHPEQDRAISLREAAILQSFPRDYAFIPPDGEVSFKVLGRLIGNAVPVDLGRAIARSINQHLASVAAR